MVVEGGMREEEKGRGRRAEFQASQGQFKSVDELGTEWLLPQEARAARTVAEGGLARTRSGQTSEKSGRPVFFGAQEKESDAGLQQ